MPTDVNSSHQGLIQSVAPVLSVQGISKSFGEHRAVDVLSLELRRGECLGLLGPNGAGKSTTLKMVLGLARADTGQISILGHEIPGAALQARQHIGVVPQADALDPDFTVAENLLIYGRYFGLRKAQCLERLPDLLEFAGLQSREDARIQDLSGGMKRRLSLARALINDPDILLLDEPTTGLDPQARHLIWDRLRQLLAKGKTILLTTHFMEEAERLCSRIQIIDHGKMIAIGTPQDLIAREIEPHVLEITGENARQWAQTVKEQQVATRIEQVGDIIFAYCQDPLPLLAATATISGVRYLQRPANLEDVFLKLTGRELRD